MPSKNTRDIIIIGDAHGDFHSFAAALIYAGLMDPELNWTGGKTILVQTGDIIDRGPDPLQIDKLLDTLQPLARKAGGQVVRLVGNHELEILRRNYFITSLPYYQIEPFRCKLIDGILAGKWTAAYAAQGILATHAGVCDALFAVLKHEARPAKPTASKIAGHINKIFKAAAASGGYKHPIFNVSRYRGGSDNFGGIFWEDLSDLIKSHICPFTQVVGHSCVEEISHSEDRKIIAVDVGMSKVFRGEFEYLRIKGKNLDIVRIGDK